MRGSVSIVGRDRSEQAASWQQVVGRNVLQRAGEERMGPGA